jgi:hypothetical protein
LKYGTLLTRTEIEEKINSLKNNLPVSELFPPDYDKVSPNLLSGLKVINIAWIACFLIPNENALLSWITKLE